MAESQKDHTAINIEKFKRPFGSLLDDIDKLSWSPNASICRTPKILSRHNEEAYKPNAFSFGPFHFGDEQLERAQNIKWKYLQGLLRRLSGDSVADQEEQYRRLLNDISSVKKEAREYYAGAIESSKEEVFVEIMVLDGCFIIELFRKQAREVPAEIDDPTFSMSLLREFVKHDLILLENQIPWLVLERLFDLTVRHERKPLIQLALDYFGYIFSSVRPYTELFNIRDIEIKHILDLLRLSLLLTLEEHQILGPHETTSGWELLPCATKMNEAGIKFRTVSAGSIFDVQFRNGVLEVPSLLIQEITDTILRNLIVFEQCSSDCPPIVTSYAKLMDNLIETDKDVEILRDNGILENWLNPEETKKILKNLCNDVHVTRFYYSHIGGEVTSYLAHCWPSWRSLYMHHFTSPWAIVSQFVAAIILLLTFLQTWYSIIGAEKN